MDEKDEIEAPPPSLNRIRELEIANKRVNMKRAAYHHTVKHTIIEWTLVRSLAWSERIIVVVAAILFLMNKEYAFLTASGIGFMLFSLVFLGPVYGILMFLTALLTYRVLKRMNRYPKNSKEFRRVIYPVYVGWIPLIYFLSYHAMNFYYEVVKSVPAWESLKELLAKWNLWK